MACITPPSQAAHRLRGKANINNINFNIDMCIDHVDIDKQEQGRADITRTAVPGAFFSKAK